MLSLLKKIKVSQFNYRKIDVVKYGHKHSKFSHTLLRTKHTPLPSNFSLKCPVHSCFETNMRNHSNRPSCICTHLPLNKKKVCV